MSTDIERSLPRINDAAVDASEYNEVPPLRSRSPHLYAHRHPEVFSPMPESDGRRSLNTSAVHQLPCPNGIASKDFFDSDNRKRRKDSASPSDSGSEADDERGPLLKSLPAPPARLRKGLKNESAVGTPSPLLTPSYLDDEKRREAFEASFKRRASLQSHTSTDEETLTIRDKFRRRRRAELFRRITETILLFCVGCIACRRTLSLAIRKEIITTLLIIFGTYSSYPFRLFNYHRQVPTNARTSRRFIRIPAAFDPATLLYPVLLPIIVAASLLSSDDLFMTLNLSLGIASMPRTIVPFQDSFSGQTSVQWILSVLPISTAGGYAVRTKTSNVRLITDPDVLSLLYPLHQALLPTLGYLTTTSLLPSELQLLSVSLINILLLSSSPQAVVLQAVLWGGGLSLFLLCQRVLEWEVALARIPSWRFQKSTSDIGISSSLRWLVRRLPSRFTHATNEAPSEGSDGDEPEKLKPTLPQSRQRGSSSGNVHDDKLLSRTQTVMPQLPMQFNGYWSTSLGEVKRGRSYTLPLNTKQQPRLINAASQKDMKSQKPTSFLTKPRGLRSLTKAQATMVKWALALYTYGMVISIIAVPIRLYIAKRALHDQEPIGWALGYLFSDNANFRSITVTLGLEQWIRLPNSDISGSNGWAEEVRWRRLGAANTRLLICLHCISTISLGLAVVFRLSGFADVDTRRKVFHGMMVVMFLPTIFVDPTFVSFALTLVLAVFLLLDLFRASQLPPLSRPLTHFLAPYVDGRDHRGPVIVSHIFLLIGCSIPLWLSLASLRRSPESPWQGWEVPTRDISMISGVVCVGMGDAAASLIGRRYGRRRWCWSGGKSLEGSAAFAAAVTLGLGLARLWLLYGGWDGDSGDSWALFFGKVVVAASGASLTEAVLTGGNDNVIVPIILWLLVRGLEI
ncbi:MAG: hypothetical protein Q9213_003796 [Squamulea squamosa]